MINVYLTLAIYVIYIDSMFNSGTVNGIFKMIRAYTVGLKIIVFIHFSLTNKKINKTDDYVS